MTNRIDSIFAARRADGRKALMPFVVGGRPTPDSLPGLLEAAATNGASIVEVGIPFSDPIADGPVIAGAMHRALESGVTPESVFEAVKQARTAESTKDLGIVAMVSMSIVYRYGPAAFCAKCADAGFDGLIVPDVPLEEAEQVAPHAAGAGLTASFLIAPTTPGDRAAQIARRCTGFVYMLARSGITGEQGGGPSEQLAQRIASVRRATDLPLAVGFGIASADGVKQVVHDAGADAAIVGSALVRRLEDTDPGEANTIAGAFIGELAVGL